MILWWWAAHGSCRSIDRPAGRRTRLVCWLTGWLVSWMVGWLVGCTRLGVPGSLSRPVHSRSRTVIRQLHTTRQPVSRAASTCIPTYPVDLIPPLYYFVLSSTLTRSPRVRFSSFSSERAKRARETSSERWITSEVDRCASVHRPWHCATESRYTIYSIGRVFEIGYSDDVFWWRKHSLRKDPIATMTSCRVILISIWVMLIFSL